MARDKTAFQPMLACSDLPELTDIVGPKLVSTKYDGIRCSVHEIPMTRKLKRIANDHVFDILRAMPIHGFDGELIAGDPRGEDCINRATSAFNKKAGEPDWTYYVFDDFSNPLLTYTARNTQLAARIRAIAHPRIVHVEQTMMESPTAIHHYAKALAEAGYEGAILRDPNSTYKFGRSTMKEGYLLKYKHFTDSEAAITGFKELMINDNALEEDERGYAKRSTAKDGKIPADTLGALVCVYLPTGAQFEIGTGFDQKTRDALWAARDTLPGKLVNFRYQNITPAGKPRFPSFRCIREDI